MIYHADCIEWLRRQENGKIKCLWGDPPDDIGLGYRGFSDKWGKREDYYNWIHLVVLEALPKCKVFWLCYNAIHELEITYLFREILKYRHPNWKYDKFIWRYTFSQYNDTDCAYGYRPMVRLIRSDARMYPDAIREVSIRQQIGDARAAGPRVPDNCWSVPRVVGNSPERKDWMPTQIPIRLMERVIAFSCAEQEVFVDLFGGSGSAIRAGIKLGRQGLVHCVEQDLETCKHMAADIPGEEINNH